MKNEMIKPIVEQIADRMAYDEKIRRIEYRKSLVTEKYFDCVSNYKKYHKVTWLTSLDLPEINYRIYKDGLYIRNCPKNMMNVTEFFKNEKHSSGFRKERILTKRLYLYLKVTEPKASQIKTFYELRDFYIFIHGCVPMPNFLFDSISKRFAIYNSNLCYINISPYSIGYQSKSLLTIDNEVSIDIFKNKVLPIPNDTLRKDIFSSIKKDFYLDLLKGKKCIDKRIEYHSSELQFLRNLDDYNENLQFRIQNKAHKREADYIVYFNEAKACYRTDIPNNNFQAYEKFTFIYNSIDPSIVPENISSLLFALTKGDISIIKGLASLVVDILSPCNIQKKINIIYSKPHVHSFIEKFIRLVSGNKLVKVPYSLYDTCKKDYIINLLGYKTQGINSVLFEGHSSSIKKPGYSTVKRVISGKTISHPDEFSDTLSYINDLALIFITDDYERVKYYKSNYETNIINLYMIDESPSFELEESDLSWLRLTFSLFGLNLIKNRAIHDSIIPENIITDNDAVNEFYLNFIEQSPDSIVYALDLYVSFSSYYIKKYDNKPITQIRFTREIKNLFPTRVRDSYKKIRNSRKDTGKWGFIGIKLNEYKLDHFLDQSLTKEPSNDYKLFYNYLLEMNKYIPGEFLLTER